MRVWAIEGTTYFRFSMLADVYPLHTAGSDGRLSTKIDSSYIAHTKAKKADVRLASERHNNTRIPTLALSLACARKLCSATRSVCVEKEGEQKERACDGLGLR